MARTEVGMKHRSCNQHWAKPGVSFQGAQLNNVFHNDNFETACSYLSWGAGKADLCRSCMRALAPPTSARMTDENVSEAAVATSWPCITHQVVTTRAPTPVLRKS